MERKPTLEEQLAMEEFAELEREFGGDAGADVACPNSHTELVFRATKFVVSEVETHEAQGQLQDLEEERLEDDSSGDGSSGEESLFDQSPLNDIFALGEARLAEAKRAKKEHQQRNDARLENTELKTEVANLKQKLANSEQELKLQQTQHQVLRMENKYLQMKIENAELKTEANLTERDDMIREVQCQLQDLKEKRLEEIRLDRIASEAADDKLRNEEQARRNKADKAGQAKQSTPRKRPPSSGILQNTIDLSLMADSPQQDDKSTEPKKEYISSFEKFLDTEVKEFEKNLAAENKLRNEKKARRNKAEKARQGIPRKRPPHSGKEKEEKGNV